jgi:N-methylhydantoinase B
VDVVLGALARALPEVMPAASAGTMNNVSIGGQDPFRGRAFAYYETVGGGAGAGPLGDGLSGVHIHMTNTLNTPVEALEMTYPFRIRRYELRRGSGGVGEHRGGDGLVREWQFLAPAAVTVIAERRRRGPWGLAGGAAGLPGRTTHRPAEREPVELPSKVHLRVDAGDVLTLESPGGGGWGAPAVENGTSVAD